jgi:hypothetical protein
MLTRDLRRCAWLRGGYDAVLARPGQRICADRTEEADPHLFQGIDWEASACTQTQ